MYLSRNLHSKYVDCGLKQFTLTPALNCVNIPMHIDIIKSLIFKSTLHM